MPQQPPGNMHELSQNQSMNSELNLYECHLLVTTLLRNFSNFSLLVLYVIVSYCFILYF